MIFSFDKKTEDFLKLILNCAQKQNLRLFFVGGIVRDYFFAQISKTSEISRNNFEKNPQNSKQNSKNDIDLLIEGDAISFSKTLPSEIQVKSQHKDFNTVKLKYEDIDIDLASSRVEIYPCSGSLPKVVETGVSIEKDFKRRDFTINSLYCELKLNQDKIEYEFIDPCSGLLDIKKEILRSLHKNSYIDDPTRILRGLNFKYRFGLDFSSLDKTLIKDFISNIEGFDPVNASTDRILQVLYKNMATDNLDYTFWFFENIVKENPYKFYKICKILFNNSDPKNLPFDPLKISGRIKEIKEIVKIFNLNNFETADFLIMILKNSPIRFENNALSSFLSQTEPIKIIKRFSNLKNFEIAYYYFKTKDKNALFYETHKNITLKITGNDLINLGIEKGPKIGEILENLLNEKLKNPQNFETKESELNLAQELIKNY